MSDSSTNPSPVTPIDWRSLVLRTLEFAKAWFWQGMTAVLAVGLLIFVVVLFLRGPEMEAEDVAVAWNRSISRLGISPVFPPEEDMHVGDIWAIIDEPKDENIKPLRGRGIRIGHLDLREEIKKLSEGRPVFAETGAQASKELPFRKQDRKEVARTEADRSSIVLTLAAFPGITITHTKRASGVFGALFGGLGLGGADQQNEEIRIPVAETYGVMAEDGYRSLFKYCTSEDNWCKDERLRTLLAFAVSPAVFQAADGRFTTPLQVRLITRVYLTREVVQRQGRRSIAGGSLQIGQEAVGPLPDVPPTGDASNRDAALDALTKNTNTAAGNRKSSGAVSVSRGDSADSGIQEVFPRPVVFGYRAVTFKIDPIPSRAPSSSSSSQSDQKANLKGGNR